MVAPSRATAIAVDSAGWAPTHSSTACAPPVSVMTSSATRSPRPCTTSVAPSRRATSSRCSWWPITVTLSAPSRRAASTAHSPTAPSPTIATRCPNFTPADMAAWCPVGSTSHSGSNSSGGASRSASPCAPSCPGSPNTPPSTQDVVSPDRQYSHVPSDQVKGEITRSPGRTVRTSAPTSVTTPRNSWPIRSPGCRCPYPRYAQRSVPHRAADTTRTTASVGSSTSGSGTCWIRMLPGPSNTAARIPRDPSGPRRLRLGRLRLSRPGHVRALRPQPVDRAHRLAQLGQPGVGVLADQPHAPGQRLRPGPGNARVDERVEHLPLRLPQPGHHRRRQRGEQLPGAAGDGAPGDLAAVPVLGLLRDRDPLVPGVLPEPADPAGLRRAHRDRVAALDRRRLQRADHQDLVPVNGHARRAGEPAVRQPAGEPARRVIGRRQVGLLPAPSPAEPATVPVPTAPSSHHRSASALDYTVAVQSLCARSRA